MNNTNKELESLIILNGIPDLGPIRINKLLKYFSSAENVLKASYEELKQVESIGPFVAKNIINFKTKIDPKKEIDIAKKNNTDIIPYNDIRYPTMLKYLPDAPKIIYVKGEIKKTDFSLSISIVGTRKPTSYGKLVVENLIKGLSKYNITIISGLAYGIDTLAHEFAIKNGLRTIAVLGNGIGIYYPSANKFLQDKIPSYGALISEFPFKSKPSKTTFPQRNRIIAALSLGTLVIEADIKSGAIITAKFALDLGKDVFAVPGNIFSRQSNGTNYLIKNGAKIVTSAEDIIEEIKSLVNCIKEEPTKKFVKQNNVINLDDEKTKVLNIIKSEPEGIHIDKLQLITSLELKSLMNTLYFLEINSYIKSLPGKIYISI
ncbi:MAG: DNA-processing protein DprA [Endomicrobiia bacterium]